LTTSLLSFESNQHNKPIVVWPIQKIKLATLIGILVDPKKIDNITAEF
jgi:hypothetical protein